MCYVALGYTHLYKLTGNHHELRSQDGAVAPSTYRLRVRNGSGTNSP